MLKEIKKLDDKQLAILEEITLPQIVAEKSLVNETLTELEQKVIEAIELDVEGLELPYLTWEFEKGGRVLHRTRPDKREEKTHAPKRLKVNSIILQEKLEKTKVPTT